MKILAFAATSSKHSINKQLVGYATRILEDQPDLDVTVETIDLNDYEMPIYSIDRQNEGGIPQAAHDFFEKIGQADAVLISFAEHNGFYTAAYKNLFDWASRIDMRVYQDKPTVMLATSAGPGGGTNALRTAVGSAQFFGNDIVAELAVPSFHANFDTATGSITDAQLDTELRAALAALTNDRQTANV
jgi:NAD(P)H-dependent FMN reductase